MKCLVFAYSQLGYDCLHYILTETPYTVCAVITHEDSPNETVWFDSVKDLAESKGIPTLTPNSLKDTDIQDTIGGFSADIILSFYYRNMIPESILAMPSLGAYNIHGSLLPKYRGRCPVNWAILHGETKTGVTLHEMVKAADAGAIVDQATTKISETDTAGDVMERMCDLAIQALKRSLPLLAAGSAPKVPQDHTQASYFGGRKPADGEIDWAWPAKRIHNLIRALQPSPQYPPAFGIIDGVQRNVIESRVVDNDDVLHMSGQIVQDLGHNAYIIACGENGADRLWIRTHSL